MKAWPQKKSPFHYSNMDHLSCGVCAITCHRLQEFFETEEHQSSGLKEDGRQQQLIIRNVDTTAVIILVCVHSTIIFKHRKA